MVPGAAGNDGVRRARKYTVTGFCSLFVSTTNQPDPTQSIPTPIHPPTTRQERVSAQGLDGELPLDDKSAAFEALESRNQTLRQRRKTTIETMFSERASPVGVARGGGGGGGGGSAAVEAGTSSSYL